MAFTGPAPRRRRPGLAPMIDVVFLLLVFFMLAARFGIEHALPLPLGGSGDGWRGPPRLVDVRPEALRLNGFEIGDDALPDALADLTESPTDPILLRARDGASVQRIADVAETLAKADHAVLVLVE